jgi:hypothetical protein
VPENGDRDLSRLFAELRRADAASTPAFRSVLERPRATGAPRLALLPVIVVVGAVLASVFLLREASRKPAPKRPEISLAQWTSPTDSLLRFSGSELLGPPPALTEWPAVRDFERSWSPSTRPTPRETNDDSRSKGERS